MQSVYAPPLVVGYPALCQRSIVPVQTMEPARLSCPPATLRHRETLQALNIDQNNQTPLKVPDGGRTELVG